LQVILHLHFDLPSDFFPRCVTGIYLVFCMPALHTQRMSLYIQDFNTSIKLLSVTSISETSSVHQSDRCGITSLVSIDTKSVSEMWMRRIDRGHFTGISVLWIASRHHCFWIIEQSSSELGSQGHSRNLFLQISRISAVHCRQVVTIR